MAFIYSDRFCSPGLSGLAFTVPQRPPSNMDAPGLCCVDSPLINRLLITGLHIGYLLYRYWIAFAPIINCWFLCPQDGA